MQKIESSDVIYYFEEELNAQEHTSLAELQQKTCFI